MMAGLEEAVLDLPWRKGMYLPPVQVWGHEGVENSVDGLPLLAAPSSVRVAQGLGW